MDSPSNKNKREYAFIAIIGAVFLVFSMNALIQARITTRDDLRIADVTNLKRAMELYFNQHEFYPFPPDGTSTCTTTNDSGSWLFSDTSMLIKEQHIDAIPHDVRENSSRAYKYCSTKSSDNKTLGYYIEAHLEQFHEDEVDFDEDETRKFDFRILNENKATLYRVCGGSEKQCEE